MMYSFPDHFQVNVQIIVRNAVSHSNNSMPGDFAMLLVKVI